MTAAVDYTLCFTLAQPLSEADTFGIVRPVVVAMPCFPGQDVCTFNVINAGSLVLAVLGK